MTRRRFLLAGFTFVVIGVVTLLIIFSRDTSASGAPLSVHFGGFTNNAAGNQFAVLIITNHTKRKIAFTIYPAQQRELTGWPQELPMAALLMIHELPSSMSTNYVTDLGDFRFPSRFPVQLRVSPSRLEATVERVRTAFHARSLKPLYQPNVPAFQFMLTNVVYSEELPVLKLRRQAGGSEAQE